MFEEAIFELHQWQSNEPQIEGIEIENEHAGDLPSCAKQQVGVQSSETKLSGLSWNKVEDTLSVAFPKKLAETTKGQRPVSPAWDNTLSHNLEQRWLGFLKYLPQKEVFRDTENQWMKWSYTPLETPVGLSLDNNRYAAVRANYRFHCCKIAV